LDRFATCFLLAAGSRASGQGARVAGKITTLSLTAGTVLTVAIVGVALGVKALWVVLAAVVITGVSGAYYRHRIGGVTGDCLGATNQITEVAVYFAGVVLR
jgi:adenosylcobinamide-GDP ribazoletransferase